MNKPKLVPLSLIEDQPIDGREDTDRLGMGPFAEVVAAVAVGTQGPFTIGVYGGWGSGKTSLLRQAKARIDDDDEARSAAVTVWFNAWQFEREDHPLFPLIAAIVEAVERRLSDTAGLADRARDGFRTVVASLRALTRGMKFEAKVGMPLVGEVGIEFDAEKALRAEELIGNQTNPLQGEMLYQTAFALLEQVTEGQGGAPGPKVIVFIDDLDRCLPDNAVRLLESIKLVLAQRGFVFVLGLDKRVVEGFLRRRYRRDFGLADRGIADTYLHKIVQLELHVPPHQQRFEQYVRRLIEARLPAADPHRELLLGVAPVLIHASDAVPRTLVRLVNDLLVDLRLAEGWLHDADSDRTDVAACIVVGRVTRRLVQDDATFRRLVAEQDLCSAIASHDESAPPTGLWAQDPTSDFPERDSRKLLEGIRRNRPLWDLLRGSGRVWLDKPDLRQRVYTFHRERDETAVPETQQAIFDRAVRKALGLGEQDPIPRGRFSEVTRLHLGGEGDFDDSGLRLLADLSNLEGLWLPWTRVSDLTPLAGLSRLEQLALNDTQVSDLAPLARLPKLAWLGLRGTPVSDLTPLDGLTNLEYLQLAGTPVPREQVEALRKARPDLRIVM